MNERLFQFTWQFQYFNPSHLTTQQGETITVIHPGQFNKNQGPDFLNAKIKIGGTTWAGHVELHVLSSHWKEHGHDDDENYKNVILHVVWEEDKKLDLPFPVLELKGRISKLMIDRYNTMLHSAEMIPCYSQLKTVDELVWNNWKQRLLVERLLMKADQLQVHLTQTHYHWEEVLWRLLAKNFGIKVNADAFEQIAVSLPVSVLGKHKNQLQQLEALLMGQANMLNTDFNDDYCIMLQKEYRFLKKKYALQPVNVALHYLRMRPSNFPSVRLAQLAMLIHQSNHLFSNIINATSVNQITSLLDVTANDYWHYHYMPGRPSVFKKKQLGKQMINNVIINTIAPLVFAYGHNIKEDRYKEKALRWLEQAAAESNNITRMFTSAGIVSNSAFDSQALIHLGNYYCSKKRCLECAAGNAILKRP